MSRMSVQAGDRPSAKLACLRMLAQLQLDPARRELISGFVDAYLRLTIEQEREFEIELQQIQPQEREGVMEIVTSWMEKGLARGLEQGFATGERKVILRQLRKRLGRLDPATEERLDALSPDELEGLGEALLDFSCREDLDSWLRARAG